MLFSSIKKENAFGMCCGFVYMYLIGASGISCCVCSSGAAAEWATRWNQNTFNI